MSDAELQADASYTELVPGERSRIFDETRVTTRLGILIGIADQGLTPLVIIDGQRAGTAIRARTTIDLRGIHIGRELVLVFENDDPTRPIVVGSLPPKTGFSTHSQSGSVELDMDGTQLVVTALERLTLRCGKSSIVLTREGKVIIEGEYVSSRSSGVNRITGGSVQIN